MPILSNPNRYQHCRRINPALGSDLGVDRIQPDIRVATIKLSILPYLHFFIDLSSAAADKAAIYVFQTQVHKQLVHLSSRNSGKVGLADDTDQSPVHPLILLQNRRVEAAVTELRNAYAYRPQSCAERLFTLTVAIAVVSPAFHALIRLRSKD